MGLLGAALRGWLRLVPWLLLLGGLAGSGWWRYYVAPRQVPYLWAGLAALGVVLLASEVDALLGREAKRRTALRQRQPLPRPRPARPGDWLEAAVHWLPLALLLLLGPTTLTLSNSAGATRQLSARQRTTPQATASRVATPVPANTGRQYMLLPPRPAVAGPTAPTPPSAPATSAPREVKRPAAAAPKVSPAAPAAAVPQAGPARPTKYRATDLAKLFGARHAATDEPVSVVGRLHRVKGDDQVVPEGIDPHSVSVVLYRYVVWCCIADAIPATAILRGVGADSLPSETWVRVSGRLEHTGPEHDIPLLKVDKVEAVPEPADPYLYVLPGDL